MVSKRIIAKSNRQTAFFTSLLQTFPTASKRSTRFCSANGFVIAKLVKSKTLSSTVLSFAYAKLRKHNAQARCAAQGIEAELNWTAFYAALFNYSG
jgi:hypothetical protein